MRNIFIMSPSHDLSSMSSVWLKETITSDMCPRCAFNVSRLVKNKIITLDVCPRSAFNIARLLSADMRHPAAATALIPPEVAS